MPCPEKFSESLVKFNVEQKVVDEIQKGYEDLVSKSPKKEKAAYFKRAVDIMDEKLAPEQVQEILESNACCKTGTRNKASKEFAQMYAELPLEEKLDKISNAHHLNMGSPELTEDGTLRVHAIYYIKGDRFECACSNFHNLKRDYRVSRSYCYCCGGHFKYHYEIMLGLKLRLKGVDSSPLDTEGGDPCIFDYEIICQ